MMGLSGLFLCSFLVVHLFINLFLFKQDGGATFDVYGEFMATYPLIRPLEWILFGGFLLHAFVGIWLWVTNRQARPQLYEVNPPVSRSSQARSFLCSSLYTSTPSSSSRGSSPTGGRCMRLSYRRFRVRCTLGSISWRWCSLRFICGTGFNPRSKRLESASRSISHSLMRLEWCSGS
ncbi:MAG: succinate dehydrogenase [Bacteroidetes bacterium]|nr:succinate dehydrogenase [Bacteroidota bacterium]